MEKELKFDVSKDINKWEKRLVMLIALKKEEDKLYYKNILNIEEAINRLKNINNQK